MEHLDFLMQMRRIARDSRSRGRRCHYAEPLRKEAVRFLSDVWNAGGSVDDAAEMMAVHRPTLEGWLDRATQPGPVQVHVTVNVG